MDGEVFNVHQFPTPAKILHDDLQLIQKRREKLVIPLVEKLFATLPLDYFVQNRVHTIVELNIKIKYPKQREKRDRHPIANRVKGAL